MRHAQFIVTLVGAVLSLGALQSFAGECEHCGCCTGCEKVCRLVCEEKKVDITCWGCKCEDFCVPGHSKPDCKHCEMVCGTCDDSGDGTEPYAAPKKFVWKEWIPGCAKIYTKKKLMKRTITKKIPSYKWVVEDLCGDCQSNCDKVDIPEGAQIPTPPDVDAKLLY